jgi:predicted Kef-type K+ transport protein
MTLSGKRSGNMRMRRSKRSKPSFDVGIKFNLGALLASPSSLLQVPIYLVALLAVRGLPAWLYLSLLGTRRSIAAGLFQATSLSFIVASVQIGMELKVLTEATGAALVASALLSVLIFPLSAGLVLRGAPAEPSR